jgi:DNA-binding GntR family transcriptional regulator
VVFTPQKDTVRADDLADLLAATLVHREPGWRLPRRSALARKYNVGLAEIDAAVDELARRSLIRRLPDGQLYRTSPAGSWIPVEGTDGLATRLDPMGNAIDRQTRQVSRREAPRDVAEALGLTVGSPVRAVQCVWSAAGDPVALSTAYRALSDSDTDDEAEFLPFASALSPIPPASVSVELSPSRATVADVLHLPPGHPAITVTLRFNDAASHAPVGLTVVTLRPELFRVAIDVLSG